MFLFPLPGNPISFFPSIATLFYIMKVPRTISTYLGLLISASLFDGAMGQDFVPREVENMLRPRQQEQAHREALASEYAGDRDCELTYIYLKSEEIDANIYLEGPFIGAPGSFYGGQIPMYDSPAFTNKIGEYEFATKFLKVDFSTGLFSCVGSGSYTFGDPSFAYIPGASNPTPDQRRGQIMWTATCSNAPFFTITGGQKEFSNAKGFTVFDRSVEGGSRHDIYLCKN